MKRLIKHQRFIMKKTVAILDRLVELKRLDVESKRMSATKYPSGGTIGSEKELPEAGENIVPKLEWIKRRNEHIFKTFCANHKKAEKTHETFRRNVCPIPDEFENLGNIFNPQKNSETFEAIKKDLINVNNQT